MFNIKRINRLDYAFGVGKIRAKEAKLLTKKDLLVILDSGLKESLRVIIEKSDYPEGLLEIKDSSDLEVILDSHLEGTISLIKGLLKEKELIESLLSSDDLKRSLEIAEKFKLDFLISYLRVLSDLLNIKLFFRFKNLRKEKEEFSNSLLETGYLKKEIYLKSYLEPWEIFLESFSHTRYATLVKESFEYFIKEKSFLKLEMLIEDFLVSQIRSAKYICLGPEPLLAYYLAKKNEIDLIRLLIIAKLNDLPKEKVFVRLNDTYT